MSQLSLDLFNEFISYSYKINSNYQNEQCHVHRLLEEFCEVIDREENDIDKVAAFVRYCKQNIIIFSIIQNYFNKKNFNSYPR